MTPLDMALLSFICSQNGKDLVYGLWTKGLSSVRQDLSSKALGGLTCQRCSPGFRRTSRPNAQPPGAEGLGSGRLLEDGSWVGSCLENRAWGVRPAEKHATRTLWSPVVLSAIRPSPKRRPKYAPHNPLANLVWSPIGYVAGGGTGLHDMSMQQLATCTN